MGLLNFNLQNFAKPSEPAPKPRLLMVGASKDELVSPKRLKLDLSLYDACIAVDGGAEWLRHHQIVPKYFVGDADTVLPSTLKWLEKHEVKTFLLDTQKDETDFHHAIQITLEEFPEGANIDLVGFLGGKTEHFLGVLGVVKKFLLIKASLTFTFIGKDRVAFVLSSPEKRSLSFKDLSKEPTLRDTFVREGEDVRGKKGPVRVSVVPLTKCLISEEGFEWELENKLLAPLDDLGISNEIVRSDAKVTCHQGVALLICAH